MDTEIKYYTTAALGNVLQIALCFFATFVGMFLNINNALLALILIIAEIAIWAICGFRLALSANVSSPVKLVGAAFIALFPILFYTLVAYMSNAGASQDTQGWTQFFFIGGPLIFFNRPVAILINMFKGNAYGLFLANYAIIAASYIAGGLFGYAVFSPGVNRREKREKKEEKRALKKAKKEEKKKAKKEKKEGSENIEDIKSETMEDRGVDADDPEKVSDYTDVSDTEMKNLSEGEELDAVKELKDIPGDEQ